MSFFKKLFGSSDSNKDEGIVVEKNRSVQTKSKKNSIGRKPSFGRYTDMNKTKNQLEYWDKSIQLFKEKKYLESFKAFIKYCGDDIENNYKLTDNGNDIAFEFTQGSKVIKGKANNEKITAEASVVLMEKPSVPVMRKLMNINFALTYSHFSLKDNVVYLKFSSHSIDASPNKLYAALKELATKADQQDDLLVSEFSAVNEINTDHIIKLSEQTIDVRYKFLTKWINETLTEIKGYDPIKDNGGISFLLLSLSYKIDYLLIPQGQLMDKLEKIQRVFFAKTNETNQEKNNKIITEFEKIITSPKEKITEGFYNVKSTFALAKPANHKQLMDFIYGEINKAKWYTDNGFHVVTKSIYEYAVSYSFFNFGIIYSDAQLLDVYMTILNQDYYNDMGIERNYIDNNVLNEKNIKKDINLIVKNAKADFPFFNINVNNLKFTSVIDFGNSLFKEMDILDYRKQ